MDANQNNINTAAPNQAPPARQLKTNRGLGKFILLSIVTLGIYSLFFFAGIANDINETASRYDGKKTMNYWLLVFIMSWLTLGIAPIVWMHRISNRIGNEARRRGSTTDFGASTFWLWDVLGSLIIVGPFIYVYKMCEVMNAVNASYNQVG